MKLFDLTHPFTIHTDRRSLRHAQGAVRQGITHLENLGGALAEVGARRCLIGAFPMPIVGGEASPCRVVAFVDEP
jgi:kynurenine formamidase